MRKQERGELMPREELAPHPDMKWSLQLENPWMAAQPRDLISNAHGTPPVFNSKITFSVHLAQLILASQDTSYNKYF